MAPHSLTSLDAVMSPFPSCTPRTSFHCNGWGRFSKEVPQSQLGDMDLLQGGKAQTAWD